MELWSPAASHTYRSCDRKNEPKNGRTARTVFSLWDGGASVPVCLSFWKETFGLGKAALRTLTKSATSYKLAEYKNKGQKNTEKESMCREFIATVPRHYSHFSVSSCNEYVDCASNALNLSLGQLAGNRGSPRGAETPSQSK